MFENDLKPSAEIVRDLDLVLDDVENRHLPSGSDLSSQIRHHRLQGGFPLFYELGGLVLGVVGSNQSLSPDA